MISSDELEQISGPGEPALTQISIAEALDKNWLDVWYQPKIDLRRKCLAGAEALVRMHHPQAGLLWPEDYLGLLDDDALAKLTEHALLTTLRHWTTLSNTLSPLAQLNHRIARAAGTAGSRGRRGDGIGGELSSQSTAV